MSGTQDLDNVPKIPIALVVPKTVWAKAGPWRNDNSLCQGAACVEGKGFRGGVHTGIQITRWAGVLENNTLHLATVDVFFF